MLLLEKYIIVFIVATLFKGNVGENLIKSLTAVRNEDDFRIKRNVESVESVESNDDIMEKSRRIPPGHNKPNQNKQTNQNNGRPNRPNHKPGSCNHRYNHNHFGSNNFGPNHFPYHNKPKPLHPIHGNLGPHRNFYNGYGPNSFLPFNIPKPVLQIYDECIFPDGNKLNGNKCLHNKNNNKPDCDEQNTNGDKIFEYVDGIPVILLDTADIRK